MLKIFTLIAFFGFHVQTSSVVVRTNGDEIRLTNIALHQVSKAEGASIAVFMHNGKKKEIGISDLKRINLKEISGRKKGVITWKALLIRKDNQKLEIMIDLDKVSGVDSNGDKIEISGSSIDKISF